MRARQGHSLRRAALRSAVSASRTISTQTRVTPFAARAAVDCNAAARISSLQAVRYFSQTVRKASEDKDLEEAQRKSEEDFERQVVEDARHDVEESVAQSEADVQEAMQEAPPPSEPVERVNASQGSNHSAFVRNLVFELTEEHLTKAFAKYGAVSNAYIARDPRGMSKGYGFVSFATAEELREACANVNGSFWHGRRITCIPRSPDSNNNRTSEGRDKHRNSPNEPTTQLFLGNIPYETTDVELNRLFRGMDNLKDVRVAVDRTTGWPRGFAHADFATVESATEAKNKLQGAMLGDRPLRIDFAEGFQRKNERSSGRDQGMRDNRRDSRRDHGSRDNRRGSDRGSGDAEF
ncbi:hypothetical protein C8A00DRAFT_44646 [Chaetomidium leptoderma]|uniref:RRM domain-containing protein n=1 Tax=Chaetomidium leptoderma TaxID=669021 RepID=A0AAN6VJ55_9PEZI|nr:hypothetical protein C8A00DRAFT_44646 [Chaetomidium leptoderma]